MAIPKRRSQWNAVRLVKSLRGEGVLCGRRSRSRPVSYCIDLYAQGVYLSGDGDIRGDLVDLVDKVPINARLRLADGEEVEISFRAIEPDVASIELASPVPSTLASSDEQA
jgi:hypothetical protein